MIPWNTPFLWCHHHVRSLLLFLFLWLFIYMGVRQKQTWWYSWSWALMLTCKIMYFHAQLHTCRDMPCIWTTSVPISVTYVSRIFSLFLLGPSPFMILAWRASRQWLVLVTWWLTCRQSCVSTMTVAGPPSFYPHNSLESATDSDSSI